VDRLAVLCYLNSEDFESALDILYIRVSSVEASRAYHYRLITDVIWVMQDRFQCGVMHVDNDQTDCLSSSNIGTETRQLYCESLFYCPWLLYLDCGS
jgi:hypothetical protein